MVSNYYEFVYLQHYILWKTKLTARSFENLGPAVNLIRDKSAKKNELYKTLYETMKLNIIFWLGQKSA